eukprot:1149281-Pelagomonas_calceolata.AAC.3
MAGGYRKHNFSVYILDAMKFGRPGGGGDGQGGSNNKKKTSDWMMKLGLQSADFKAYTWKRGQIGTLFV